MNNNTTRTVKNIDGIVKTFNNDADFLEYVQTIYRENEDGQPYPSEIHWLPENLQQAMEYLIEYCPELELTEPEQIKEATDTMPLWKKLNSERTEGEWKLPEQEQSMNQYTVITDDMTIADILAIDIPDEEGYANAQYTALAVNHFAEIAVVLDNLIKVAADTTKNIVAFEGADELDAAIDKAKEALSKIS